MSVLSVRNLSISFRSDRKDYPVVRSISFDVGEGECLGIVGESGCGKSVTSLAVMGLLPEPPGRITDGEILFNGQDLRHATKAQMRALRRHDLSMIFQEPMTSLNPVYTIGNQLCEAILSDNPKMPKKEVFAKAVELLGLVGITTPERNMKVYPHQLSGGMRQRVMIAMALACNPKLLIADEPTTALDVTIQAQVLELMRQLKSKIHSSIILITHDLGVVAEMVDRVVVMYGGSIVEEAMVQDIFYDYRHPYTEGLLKSIPSLNEDQDRLYTIQGAVPHPSQAPSGCYFHPRCPYATEICREQAPPRTEVGAGHFVRCFHCVRNEP